MSRRSIYRCGHCARRVKRAPFISLIDRQTRKEIRFHGGECSGTALARAQELGPDRVILRFAHPRSCGDPKGKLECSGQCFVIAESARTMEVR
jgi:hypothetical protein